MSDRALDSLFAQALQIPEGEERDAFVSRSCGEDHALRAELLSLVKAHEEATDFLEDAPAAIRLMASGSTPPLGGHIGPYCLERVLGRGGMGTVYLATQKEPVQRQVAIKVLSTVELAPEALSRFHIERHALCRLEHPNISRLFDAGSLPDGTPYFVMDRFEGEPVDEYCAKSKSSRTHKIQLLADVCDTLHYAHGRGVLHRDLKPSNVLAVRQHDDTQIRVIDFGMAQLDDERFPEGARGGTPAYASPEQAAGSIGNVTADVFSLGMIGCRLLSDWAPEDGRDSIARKLKSLPDDLEAIMAKATCEAPEQRYQSAEAMAADLRCFLDRRPVSAKNQSSWYIGKLFVKRNPVAVGIAAASTVALAAATFHATKAERGIAAALERERELRAESEMMAEYCRNLLRTPDALSLQRSAQVKDLLAAAATDASERFPRGPISAPIFSQLSQTATPTLDTLWRLEICSGKSSGCALQRAGRNHQEQSQPC